MCFKYCSLEFHGIFFNGELDTLLERSNSRSQLLRELYNGLRTGGEILMCSPGNSCGAVANCHFSYGEWSGRIRSEMTVVSLGRASKLTIRGMLSKSDLRRCGSLLK